MTYSKLGGKNRLEVVYQGKFEGALPLQKPPSPSPLKERGIKRVRLINNLISQRGNEQ